MYFNKYSQDILIKKAMVLLKCLQGFIPGELFVPGLAQPMQL
jgi:hypothetical protein